MKLYTYIFALLLFTTVATQAQTVALPDANLINKLKTDYPSVMVGNNLSIPAANSLTGSLMLNDANITDATGIEHFTTVHTLSLDNNSLTTLPNISGLTNLKNLYIQNNQLTTLPNISTLTALVEFQVHENQLTSLPDFSGNPNLKQLYCGDNNLTALPPLTQFSNLSVLVMGNNPIEGQIDFSPLTNLTQLHVHQTGIKDSIKGLSKLTKLNTLFAWGNEITSFSALNNNTILNTCVISDNMLNELPVLSNKPGLGYLDITNNYLSFEDILPILQGPTPVLFFYNEQKNFTIDSKTNRVLDSVAFTHSFDTNLPSNVYVWKKGDAVLDSSASNTFIIDPLLTSDEGTYTLKVYNPGAPNLVLSSYPFTLTVEPCLELQMNLQTPDKDCSKGYTLDFSNSIIQGGLAPFEYTVTSAGYSKSSTKKVLENVPAGKYTFTLTDAQGCMVEDAFTLNRIERCDPVFSPNGDGFADTYFIEEAGTIQVYDVSRNLITTLEGPTVWDGTTSDGSPVDAGYYVLIAGSEVIYLTLVR